MAALVPTAGEHSEIQFGKVGAHGAPGDAHFQQGHVMKRPHRRQFLHLAVGVAALPAASSIVGAQTYPSRPITIVVPVAVGGSMDTIGRVMAERMNNSLGRPVIIENVTGGGGTVGVGRVAHAPPDGYTLVLGNNGSHVVAGVIYALRYDLLNDFEPVALLSTYPFVLVARKTMPANDLNGLIAWLKASQKYLKFQHQPMCVN